MRKMLLALMIPVLAAAACPAADVTGPNTLDFEFQAREIRSGQLMDRPVVTATSIARGIRIDARLNTPDPCRIITAEAGREGGVISMNVMVQPRGGACIQVVGVFEYEALMRNLEPGNYRVRITHSFAATGSPGPHVVFDQDVVVR